MENRKNTVLLTVIAVATLLVAVVGATFAYFSAQTGASQQIDIDVKTNTADSVVMSTMGTIEFTATQDNFLNMPNASAVANDGLAYIGEKETGVNYDTETGYVTFHANDAANSAYCYTVTLKLTGTNGQESPNTVTYGNDFVHTQSGNPAELKLTITKNGTAVINEQDITTTVTDIQVPTTNGGSTYTHQIDATANYYARDTWVAEVEFENLNGDQGLLNADGTIPTDSSNLGKTFRAALVFARATSGTCTYNSANDSSTATDPNA